MPLDMMHMADTDNNTNFEDPAHWKEARRNKREIRSNIPKLIRIFMQQKDKRDRFEKEFSAYIKNSELKNFSVVFDELKRLWNIHLTTSKEEVDSIRKQTAELEYRTSNLGSQIIQKTDDLDKRIEHQKEAKQQKQKELDNLTQDLNDARTRKQTQTDKLQEEANEEKAMKLELH
jgi:hypothetical protein